MLGAKFSLIVEGFGYHSFRLTEVLAAGSIPVIVIDHYVLVCITVSMRCWWKCWRVRKDRRGAIVVTTYLTMCVVHTRCLILFSSLRNSFVPIVYESFKLHLTQDANTHTHTHTHSLSLSFSHPFTNILYHFCILHIHSLQPYEDLLDWENFSIRIPEHRFLEVIKQREKKRKLVKIVTFV